MVKTSATAAAIQVRALRFPIHMVRKLELIQLECNATNGRSRWQDCSAKSRAATIQTG
jgi:hypothetical protein